LSTQPNPDGARKLPPVILTDTGRLVVDPDTTIDLLRDVLTAQPAPALAGLFNTSARVACYLDRPAPTGYVLVEGHVSPSAQRLEHLSLTSIVKAANAAGCQTLTWRIWSDDHRPGYVAAPRTVEVLRMIEPWRYTRIDASAPLRSDLVVSATIPAGDYLIASMGEQAADRILVIGAVAAAPTTGDLEALPGFTARQITARCSRCSEQWISADGSVLFNPVGGGSHNWRMSASMDLGLVTSTIPCPMLSCEGRISFSVTGGQS
jgi:hypothetical protein